MEEEKPNGRMFLLVVLLIAVAGVALYAAIGASKTEAQFASERNRKIIEEGKALSSDPAPEPTPSPYKSPDEKTGWGGLKWGDPPPKDAKCSKQDEELITFCERPKADDKMIGQVRLRRVSYMFHKNRLYYVSLEPSPLDMDVIERSLKEVYGPPMGPLWIGETVTVSYISTDRFRNINYSYSPISEEVHAAKKARDASVKEGL